MKTIIQKSIILFCIFLTFNSYGGVRPDINSFSPFQRVQLKNLILQHASANGNEVINEHLNGMANGMAFHNYNEFFLSWHRDYISDLENFLNNNGGSMFVPLPKWNPTNCIPNEFFTNAVVPGYPVLNNQCPSGYNFSRFLNCTTLCNNYEGTNAQTFCGRTRTTPIDKFAADLECEHNPVHGSIGGVMSSHSSPAAAIFWLWHAWIDDIYWDYEQNCTNSPPVCSLSLSTSSMDLPSTSGFLSIFNVTSNSNWTVLDNANWINLNTTSGSNNGEVIFSCTKNTSTFSRTGTITVSCGGLTRTVTIVQDGASPNYELCLLGVSQETFNISSSGGEETFNVLSSSSNWVALSNSNWIILNPNSGSNNGQISFNCTENTSTLSRMGIITISCGGITRTVTIVQNGASSNNCLLGVSQETINISSLGGGETFNVTSNGNWIVSDNANWITLNTNGGSNNGQVSFNYTTNTLALSRMGTITVSCGGITRTVTIVQGGASSNNPCLLGVSQQTIYILPLGQEATFNVSSNSNWTATTSDIWIRLYTTSGSGNGVVNFSCKPLSSSIPYREGTITLTCGNSTKTVTILQGLILVPDLQRTGSEGSTKNNDASFSKRIDQKTVLNEEKIKVYPNPFSERTTISFQLEEETTISLEIFDVRGQLVHTIVANERLNTGAHNYEWDAQGLTSGIYLYVLKTDESVKSGKLILN